MMLSRRFAGLAALATTSLLSLGAVVLQDQEAPTGDDAAKEAKVRLHYLEIVTPDLDKTCDLLSELHGVRFGEPQLALGNARTAKLADGGLIGVRKPMHVREEPVVRPYVLVKDIDAAFEKIEAAGAEVLLPPMESGEGGRYCIYQLGGIQHAIWQN